MAWWVSSFGPSSHRHFLCSLLLSLLSLAPSIAPLQVLQLIVLLNLLLHRFSSQECLHCLNPALAGLISYSALTSPFAVLQCFFVRLVLAYFEG